MCPKADIDMGQASGSSCILWQSPTMVSSLLASETSEQMLSLCEGNIVN